MPAANTTSSSDVELTPDDVDALIRALEQISVSITEAIAILESAEHMPAASTTAVHGITVEQVQMPAGRPFRAACLCGWKSAIVGARPHATEAGAAHMRRIAAS
jgi:hypothetical protein